MGVIHRYIAGELLKIFFVALTAQTLVVVVFGLVREARNQGLEPAQSLRLVPYVLPEALRYTVPATILLAACMVYGRMSGSNEITALKSSGISPASVLWPAVILAFLLSLATVWLNDAAISWGREGVRRVIVESIEDVAYGMLRSHGSYSSKQVSIIVKGVEGKRLIQPVISLMSGEQTVTLTAEEAELRGEPDKGVFTLICRNGMLDVDGHSRITFPNDVLERSVPVDFGKAQDKKLHPAYIEMWRLPTVMADQRQVMVEMHDEWAAKAALQMMTGDGRGLLSREWDTEEALYDHAAEMLHRLRTETYRRWSNGFSCLCFVLVGVPLAVWRRNSDFLTTFCVCFAPILLVYYPLLMIGVDRAKLGTIPPATVWFGNVMLLVIAVPLLRRMVRY